MEKEKIKNIYYKYGIIVEFVLALVLSISIYKIMYKLEDFNSITIPELIIAIVSGGLLLTSVIINILKNKGKLEKIFLHVVVPIGMLYMVFMIPCQAPDEEGHIFKAYDVSLGHLVTQVENDGDIYVPKQMLEMYRANIDSYSKVHKFLQKTDIDYNNTTTVQTAAKANSALGYPLSAIMFAFGRILNLNILLVTYIAKMANFLLYVIIGYFIIKKAGFGKLIFFTYMLLPMILHQATSVSADTISNLSILFFISYVLKLLKQEENISFKQRLLYYFVVGIIPLGKVVYFPLVSIGYILISNKNIKKKEKMKLLITSTLIAGIIGLSWYMWSKNYTDRRDYYEQAGVNSSQQIQGIIQNPLKYGQVLINTNRMFSGYYLATCIGRDLGRLNINVPEITIYLFMLLLFASPFLEKHKLFFNRKQKLWLLFVFIAMSVVMVTTLYVGWTPVGLNHVAGMQGRYFIPILILILLCLCMKDKDIEFKNTNVFYSGSLIFLNLSAIATIINFF